MSYELFKNTATGRTFALDTVCFVGLTEAHVNAFTAAGWAVTNVTADVFRVLVIAHGFNPDDIPGSGVRRDKIASITLNVQGASEDFITGQLQQVLNSFGSQTNTINANVVIMRDQVKTHVTDEANRVIASV